MFDAGGAGRHDDCSGNFKMARGVGDALGVVACRVYAFSVGELDKVGPFEQVGCLFTG